MSLVSAVNRCLVNTVKTQAQGRSLLSMSSGVNKVLLARNINLEVKNLEIAPGRSIAYSSLKGKKPTVVYFPGCAVENCVLDMDGSIEESLLRYCEMHEHGCVVSQGNTSKVLFSHWIEDTLTVIDRLTVGPVILVGSGLGAWLSLLAAQLIARREENRNLADKELSFLAAKELAEIPDQQTTFPSKLHSLVLWYPHLNHMPQYAHTDDSGRVTSFENLVDSLKYRIDVEKTIKIPDCPVKILSNLDESTFDFKLMKSLSTNDVEMVYRKDSLCETDGEVCLGQLNRLIMDKPAMEEDEAVDLLSMLYS